MLMSFSIILSVGKYGGFYLQRGEAMKRICLGWVAVTLITPEYDDRMTTLMAFYDAHQLELQHMKREAGEGS